MPSYNINARVLDTLMAYLLRHYPELKRLNANGPAVQRIEACALEKAITLNELLAWSSHLACNTRTPSTPSITESTHAPAITPDITEHPKFRHQAALIEQLIQVNQKLDTRLAAMEDTIFNKQQPAHGTREDSSTDRPAKRRPTSTASSLKDAWFTWYTQMPRMWASTDKSTKHTRSTTKLVVAFMKLFIPIGFNLDETAAQYPDQVLNQQRHSSFPFSAKTASLLGVLKTS
ncbi:hypothetical protein P3T76_001998 [Phytophthora citrophthora]|uniref:Uncharacterized protein n=1 Tax=Phytophthora citrophthora TaxID=4793 RepID=A0AAD9LQW7_9STRA|nr:hypothetical protein P3T76_001998 [Phytophthora citrophthora]